MSERPSQAERDACEYLNRLDMGMLQTLDAADVIRDLLAELERAREQQPGQRPAAQREPEPLDDVDWNEVSAADPDLLDREIDDAIAHLFAARADALSEGAVLRELQAHGVKTSLKRIKRALQRASAARTARRVRIKARGGTHWRWIGAGAPMVQ